LVSRKIKPIEQNIGNQPRHELLQGADILAREKGIELHEVLEATEQAIQKAAKVKYGLGYDIQVEIDSALGEISIYRVRTIVETVEDPLKQITLEEGKKLDPQAELNDEIRELLPPVQFNRTDAQSALQFIAKKMRDAERARQYIEFKDRVGEITSGLVKRIEFGNVILDLGRAEGILRREDIIPRETFRTSDRIRVFISEINPEARGHFISVSRTHPQFMAKLFEQEVPEIYDGVIEIRGVARDPGSRAKIAVYTPDTSIDPVGACVGMRGSRVQAVVNELQGEKVDIIPWSSNPATFVVNALAPAEVMKVVIDEEAKRVEVVMAEDQLSLAIGRRGQNVKLASQLTGWNIDMITEEEDINRRAEDSANRSQLFIEALDVDEMIAQLLVAEGFASIEEIDQVDITEFSTIEGFDEEIAAELKNRAQLYLSKRDTELKEQCKELGMENSLLSLEGLKAISLLSLAEAKIKTLDDLAELSGDELIDLIGKDNLTIEQANQIIMSARAHWFEDDKK
jgi:N utilization substance protein A